MHKKLFLGMTLMLVLGGCKYYGSSLPPEYPISMDDALSVANDKNADGFGGQSPVVRKSVRPQVKQPSYIPEKELAVVTPPKTLLVWTYPHVTDDNTRVFGSWSTIFLTDRYEWVLPSNATPADEMIQQPTFQPAFATPEN